MAEINLSSADLTVLGGPSSITLETNVGPAGNRGVFVMYGLLEPNDPNATFITTPQVFDLYIVADPSSDNYLQMYQYVNQDGIEQWVPSFKLSINFYGANKPLTFVNGEASLAINIFELGLLNIRTEFVTLENTRFLFNTQVTLNNYDALSLINPAIPANHYPAAVSAVAGDIYQDPNSQELFVPITIKAAEFNGTSMQPIHNKTVIASLAIFLVNPSDVTDLIGAS